MATKLAEVTFHIDEETSHDERPHLMLIEYNPDVLHSIEFVNAARDRGLHAELIGM